MFELSAGQIVADKYRIDGIMGHGGMGVVVAATHVELDQKVAIKFLREVSPEALARFQREARLLVRLKSPHVARVIDVGALEDETPYIVMEYLDGSDLASILSQRGRLQYEEAVDYVLQACEAVAEAHALGMVHRDLKPANLFLAKGAGGTSTVKVLDFGVSKIMDNRVDLDVSRGGDLTNEGVALGSPGYMSPEQMTSARDVDVRADIFSLGAVLYRLLAGQPPYRGNSVVSILASMATDPLAPLQTLAPEVPPELAEAVERCLAQDREARWPTVAHLAQALIPFANRRGRLAVEQISNTLGVPMSDEAFGTTVVRPVVPLGQRSSSQGGMPVATPGPMAVAYGHVPGGASGSHPIFPPGTVPLGQVGLVQQEPEEQSSRTVLLFAGVTALAIVAGTAAWLTARGTAHTDDDPTAIPTASATTAAATTAAAAAATTATSATSATTEPATTAAPTETAPAATTAEPPTKPPGKPYVPPRPRPHTPSTAHTPATGAPATASDPSKPPNPADVPAGRH